MLESLSLFRHLVRERWFRSKSVILFLNKCDLLAEKVKTSNLSTYFPDFKGASALPTLEAPSPF